METLALDYKSSVGQIAQLFTTGIEAWRKAGELLVQLYDADPENRAKVKSDLCGFPSGALATLERIGRKKLVSQVYASAGIGFRKLQSMPYDVQERCLKSPVELLVVDREGRTDTLKVSIKDLSKEQAAQIFGATDLRDLSAQRAYLADVRAKAAPQRVEDAYRLLKDKLVVVRPCELTRQQLTSLLAQMG
jgi:hypothetical protein